MNIPFKFEKEAKGQISFGTRFGTVITDPSIPVNEIWFLSSTNDLLGNMRIDKIINVGMPDVD